MTTAPRVASVGVTRQGIAGLRARAYPGGRDFARALFWEEYGDTRLVEASGPAFFQRVVNAKVFNQQPDEEIVRRCVDEMLPPVHDQIEKLFVASGIADPGAVTVAELSVWSAYVNLEHAGVAVDAERWPRTVGFVEAMNAHPALAPLVEEDRAMLASR